MSLRLYGVRCGYRCGNAGDEVGRDMCRVLSGQPVEWAAVEQAEIVACGSIAHHLHEAYAGHVWGIGQMFGDGRVRLPSARVAAVRGKLTAALWDGLGDVPLGDPGLLVADWFPIVRRRRYRIGIIPHYVDNDSVLVTAWLRRWPEGTTAIDICARVPDVLQAIADCAVVLSSSLHGLVFADSLGVPNAWIVLSDRVAGGTFKFRDYYTIFGVAAEPLPFVIETSPETLARRVLDSYDRPGIGCVAADLAAAFPQELRL